MGMQVIVVMRCNGFLRRRCRIVHVPTLDSLGPEGNFGNIVMHLFLPQRERRRNPQRHLEVRCIARRSDADDEVHKTAFAPSIRAADEQDSDMRDLRRGGEQQVGSGRGFRKDRMVVSQRQRELFIQRHAETHVGIAAASGVDPSDSPADIPGDIVDEARAAEENDRVAGVEYGQARLEDVKPGPGRQFGLQSGERVRRHVERALSGDAFKAREADEIGLVGPALVDLKPAGCFHISETPAFRRRCGIGLRRGGNGSLRNRVLPIEIGHPHLDLQPIRDSIAPDKGRGVNVASHPLNIDETDREGRDDGKPGQRDTITAEMGILQVRVYDEHALGRQHPGPGQVE